VLLAGEMILGEAIRAAMAGNDSKIKSVLMKIFILFKLLATYELVKKLI
jgi:hypothetical protein